MPTINRQCRKKKEWHKSDNNKQAAKIYNTNCWQLLRKSYIMEHPLCELCLANGIVKPTEEVHHIKPILSATDRLQQRELAFDSNNLVSLCCDCHHEVHKNLEKYTLLIRQIKKSASEKV